MPTLYLLDHSLATIGGHHFDTTRLLVAATTQAGWTPVVGAHRRFRDFTGFPHDLRVCSTFRRTAYSPHSATAGRAPSPIDPFATSAESDASHAAGWLARCHASWTRWRLKRQLSSFVAACRRVFQEVAPRPGDQVFLPTVTEFDLGGIVELLRTFAPARRCGWHLQFHFPMLKGPKSTYGEQTVRIDAMRRHFRTLLSRVTDVAWHFYAPTQPLVDQYNQLEVVRFELLEHPVDVGPALPSSPSLHGDSLGPADSQEMYRHDSTTTQQPFRALCAGGFRKDKGTDDLQRLVGDLVRDDALGEIQLWIQAKRVSAIQRIARGLPFYSLAGRSLAAPLTAPPSARIVHVPHPLPRDEYLRMLRTADAGVFAYSPETYAARCSGVLVEMLALGKPVLVMENTWLAEELQAAHAPPPGLLAANASEFAWRLRQMAHQRDHFRTLASATAPEYARLHQASRVIARILAAR